MLDLVDETLDQVSFTIEPFVIGTSGFLMFGTSVGRNHRVRSLFDEPIIEFLSCITAVGNHMFERIAVYQLNRLTDVRGLSSCQTQAQRVTQTIDRNVNLGAEPSATTSQCLRLLPTAFFGHRPRTDERGQSCCQSSPVPYPGRWQSAGAFFPTRPGRTSERIACRQYSSGHTQTVRAARRHRYGLSTERLPRNGDTLLHPCRCKRSDRRARNLVPLSTAYPEVSRLS